MPPRQQSSIRHMLMPTKVGIVYIGAVSEPVLAILLQNVVGTMFGAVLAAFPHAVLATSPQTVFATSRHGVRYGQWTTTMLR
eukprot:6904728-Pyramimonas_sp.AAC.1